MKNSKILVTGGSGMVGCHLKELLPDAIYISSEDCDLRDDYQVEDLFDKIYPDIVIHLAAKVGGIISNINYPAEYFDDNILMNTNILRNSKKFDVKRVIATLSTCIYPDISKTYPLKEENLHDSKPTPTNFSYGYAKRCMAVQIDAYNKQYNTQYSYLIPSNLFSEYDKYGENSHFVAALIKKIHKAKQNNEKSIVLFGTGRPLRQFMYAKDLARVIKHCIDNNITESFNVAPKDNYTIKEIAEIALKACDASDFKIFFDESKPDGQFRKDVSNEKMLKILPNFEFTKLYKGIKHTYNRIADKL